MSALVKVKITLCSAYDARDIRSRLLLEFIATQNYRIENCAKTDRTWRAVSHRGEAEDLKNLLRAQGFADYDFKIKVEYQRAWGFL